MRKRNRQAIWVVVILVVGLGGAMFIPGVRRLLVSSNNDRAFALMNHDRTSNSRYPALHHESHLQSYAQNWSNHMASTGRLEHDAIERHICCYDAIGENVGTGPTLEAIEDAFMHSPEHRRNILYPTFTQAGVGVAVSYDQHHNPIYWVTQAFRDPSGSSSSSSRPRPKPRPRPRARSTSTPHVTPTRTPRPLPSPTPSVTRTVTPSPSVLVPPPIVASPTPARAHHRGVLAWIIIGILVAFIAAMVALVAFGLPRRDPSI